MRDIAARFMAATGGGRGGRQGGGGAAPDAKFYTDWLAALKTLDFDKLSRNAQVDYLTIRHRADLYLSRVGKAIPPGPPRKPDNLGSARHAARTRRAHQRSAGLDDRVHARAADHARQQGIRVVRGRDEESLAGARVRRRLEEGRRAHERDVRSAGRSASHDHGPPERGDRLPPRERSDHRARRSLPSRCT